MTGVYGCTQGLDVFRIIIIMIYSKNYSKMNTQEVRSTAPPPSDSLSKNRWPRYNYYLRTENTWS